MSDRVASCVKGGGTSFRSATDRGSQYPVDAVHSGTSQQSILYQSPVLADLQVDAMYAFAASVTQPTPATTGNIFDLSASCSGYGLYAAIAYQYQHSGFETIPGVPGAQTLADTEHYSAGLAYRIGVVSLQANYSYNRPTAM